MSQSTRTAGCARVLAILLVALLLPTLASARDTRPAQASASSPSASPPGAAIASAHALATDAGLETLRAGGNAFDAAVTVSSVLSVVEPISSGLGGGGFFLLHDAKSGKDVFVDAREIAPKAAAPEKYLTADGEL
ncbi:MAG TPA: gamma-glutamyltransferase, partial [Xanthomonadaceae bacterium]|nr:gamma-glutamyltransferase [Xanthomonadaceae bacterium]